MSTKNTCLQLLDNKNMGKMNLRLLRWQRLAFFEALAANAFGRYVLCLAGLEVSTFATQETLAANQASLVNTTVSNTFLALVKTDRFVQDLRKQNKNGFRHGSVQVFSTVGSQLLIVTKTKPHELTVGCRVNIGQFKTFLVQSLHAFSSQNLFMFAR